MLLEVKLPPTELPLTVDPSLWSDEWLTPMVSKVFVQLRNATAVLDIVSQSWKAGFHDATLRLAQLITDGGSQSSWEARFCCKMTEIQTSIRFKNMSTSLTWLTFCIAQHFVVPLLPGILQPRET